MGKPRKQFHEGSWYHVYTRSPEEVSLFETDEERSWFLQKLDEVFVRRDVSLGALCLMDSHYHALIRMGSVRLDRALNSLHMSYTKHANSRRDRHGSLFEKHPATDIILDDSYLLQIVPYIHNNPVEASMVMDPTDYEWHTDELYRLGEWTHGPLDCWEWPPHFQEEDRTRRYKERLGEETEIPRKDEGYIGSEEDWSQLEKRDENRKDRFRDRRDRRSLDEIAFEYLESRDYSPEDLKKPGRSQPETRLRQRIMVEMYAEGYGPTEIGDFFNRDKGTVLYAVRQDDEDS
jgi:REP element-mobilizing transposase RayT